MKHLIALSILLVMPAVSFAQDDSQDDPVVDELLDRAWELVSEMINRHERTGETLTELGFEFDDAHANIGAAIATNNDWKQRSDVGNILNTVLFSLLGVTLTGGAVAGGVKVRNMVRDKINTALHTPIPGMKPVPIRPPARGLA